MYSLGVAFQNLGEKRKADECYRQFLNLVLTGVDSIHSSDDVMRHMKKLHANGRNGVATELQKAVRVALRLSRAGTQKAATRGTKDRTNKQSPLRGMTKATVIPGRERTLPFGRITCASRGILCS